MVSIPLEQGNVLRHYEMRENGLVLISLNPFGTGQCLTTYVIKFNNINPMSQSLWNRAMSYDHKYRGNHNANKWSQSLWNRAMSYDHHCFTNQAICASQSLWNRAMSYDHFFNMDFKEFLKSQSLWNRAMSYDELNEKQRRNQFPVSIPLEQGNVLRLID